MNKLVESIIEPILGEQKDIKKVIAVYPGRFQPFGPHHKAVYDFLRKKFDDVYIVTSDIKKLPRHPLNFREKQSHMSKMGVPKSKISKERNPYTPKNLLKKFDKDTTAVVFVVGTKDASRLSGGKYFQDYNTNKSNMVGFEEHGYVMIAPHITVSAGGMEVSGTSMRELLGSPKYKDNREKLFKQMFGYFNTGTFKLMTNQFSKIFESDDMMIFKPTKMMKGKKKWFDGKDKDVLFDFDLDEDITIPVKVGDTVLMGKWKNKKVKIKDIGVDKHGMPTINGKKATTFRIHNIVNIFDNEESKNEILNKFLTTIDMKSIIKEASTSGGIGADDGPSYTYGNFRTYRWRNDKEAEKLGYTVVDYILKPKHKADKTYRTYPDGPVDSVSFFPAGIGTGGTPNNQTNLTGLKGYNRWKKHMKRLAQLVGYKLFDFINDFKDTKKLVQMGSRETLKQQKEEELDEQTLTKEWWKKIITEDWWTDMSYQDQEDYIEKHPKSKKAQSAKKTTASKIKMPKFKFDPKTKKMVPVKTPDKLKYKKKVKGEIPLIVGDPDWDNPKSYKSKKKPTIKKKKVSPGVFETKIVKNEREFFKKFGKSFDSNFLTDRGRLDWEASEAYELDIRKTYKEWKSKLLPKEQKQLRKDILSWKELGGYEAIQRAIEDNKVSVEDIRKRNERIRDIAHKTITKVKLPIERGIRIPGKDLDKFLSRFEIGEMVEIPDDNGHGSSGFSIDPDKARKFSDYFDDRTDEASVVMRIVPNSKGEVRGLFIDGETDADGKGHWNEGEITRSSKSAAKLISKETITRENGRKVVIITLQEPDDLSERLIKEQQSNNFAELSKKYLEGPLNPEPNKKEVKEDIKPDVIKSFTIQNSLNQKLWDGHSLKPEIKKKLLTIANNFFKDLKLDVKLHDITLTGSISNYNWSKFSDVDLHLRIKFSEVDENINLVNNYVLSKKNMWNEKHDITIFGYPVEVYVENVGESHVASGLYSILNDKWIVEPKKKELQIDLDDIRTKAEGYLSYTAFLEKYMKNKQYDNVIAAVDKIKEKLKRMRSSGLERGGEFSVENLAFKALRRSPFIADITKMKTDAYDKKMTMGEHALTKEWWKKQMILLEGGAYGHMAHPFDDKNLTFKDLKNIITMGLGGQLNREDNVTEKLDGQNLMISWKDGKLIAARNKGHLKNSGETALDAKGITSKFAGRGSVSDAFSFAMKDLEKAIGSLSQKQKDKIFMNGKAFMNLEVMWPKNPNVIDYDKAEIIFHGALEYNDSGSPIGEVKGSGRILQGMIQQINQHVQKHYKIGKPVVLQIPKHQDFGKKKKTFISRLNKLQKQYGLKDNDTLALYHQMFWEEYIYNASKQFKYKLSNTILKRLTMRWAFGDKSYKIPQIKKDIKDEKFIDWILSTDKIDVVKMTKDNMIPFEKIFFEVGAEILKNVKGFMAANPDKAVQSMRKQLDKSISDIKSGGDINKIKKIKSQLDKINSMGGLDAIVPSEGIVFKYNGNVYKFTGAFAPVNQITGLAKFG